MPSPEPSSTPRVTSRDVAATAGVHQSTVSRALRGDPRISPATREHIEGVASDLGYVPNRPARSLRERKSGVVGVMVQDIDNAFYPLLLADIHRELAAAGYSIVLIVDPLHRRSDVSRMHHLLDASLDGLLITTATFDSETASLLHSRGIPLVLAVRSVPGLAVDIIESDNFSAGQEAARHLRQLGHTEIAAILGPEVTSPTRYRLDGMLDVAGEYIRPDRIHFGPYTHESGYALFRRLVNSPSLPTAVIAANDVVAIGAMDAAQRLGVAIPDDLSIIGFDDIPMAGWQSFRLTTIRQDTAAIATQAARRLIERIQNPHAPANHDLYPVSLTVRDTTGPPRT